MRLSFPCETKLDLYAVHSALMAVNIPGITGVSRDYDVLHVEIPARDELTSEEVTEITRIVEVNKAIPSWDEVRRQRISMLLEADWRIQRAEDNGDETTALRAYRTALRDITKQSNPDEIVWPAKPW